MSIRKDIDELPKNAANYTALTPLWFLERVAKVHPTRKSLIHGSRHYTWQQTYQRCRRFASALSHCSIGLGNIVTVIAPNVPAVYEAHFGVPMAGAVLNTVNILLNASTVAFLLNHCNASVVIVDQEFFTLAEEALKIWSDKTNTFKPPILIVIGDENCNSKSLSYALSKGAIDYEKFLQSGDPEYNWKPPEDEWQSISLGYTSGTTSSPKGVVLHHRGAYLMALSTALIWGMNEGAVFLWTLPMFHCNVYEAISKYKVTHFCGAPVVLNSIMNAPPEDTILPLPHVVHVNTGGAPPPPSLLSGMSKLGFRITHQYGLSETFGPSVYCAWKPEWDSLPPESKAKLHARQGVRHIALENLEVVNTKTMQPVPPDGKTIGEIVMRGNIIMKGYLKNPKANEESFANGWFHSGDLAVKHEDGVDIENVLYSHPAILETSVVARPDEKWGESPCAFVTLKPGGEDSSNEKGVVEDILSFCRTKMSTYMVPKSVVFGPLPKTATGKIQKNLLRAKANEMGPVKMSKL
ncbi:hypothetical protein TSUD_82860 [Trifolium subterraneum]|uniref:AMP-dependent synthetase/ligase domain-containing protein n=1 Tax=Trifolium subterraneum TaxID=3900 RepID=A0A2Z6LHK9_TRISU|nr:hypothetical protein TSUD_82860 [Trifolium subterraneum]